MNNAANPPPEIIFMTTQSQRNTIRQINTMFRVVETVFVLLSILLTLSISGPHPYKSVMICCHAVSDIVKVVLSISLAKIIKWIDETENRKFHKNAWQRSGYLVKERLLVNIIHLPIFMDIANKILKGSGIWTTYVTLGFLIGYIIFSAVALAVETKTIQKMVIAKAISDYAVPFEAPSN